MWCYLFPFVWLNKAITLKIALCALLLQELCTQERQEAGGALTSKHKISNCWHCSHHWASFVCSGEGAIWSNALTQIISFHLFSRSSLHQVKVDELREQYPEPICSSVRPFLLIIYGTSICWSAFPPTVAPERSRRSEQLAHQLSQPVKPIWWVALDHLWRRLQMRSRLMAVRATNCSHLRSYLGWVAVWATEESAWLQKTAEPAGSSLKQRGNNPLICIDAPTK